MNNKKTTGNEQAVSTATIKQENLALPTNAPKRGEMKLVLSKQEEPVNLAINPYLSLNLVVNSDGENVTAFDTIISYDPDSFDFVRVDSLSQDFKIYPYQVGNRLTLTVVKITDNSLTTVLTGEVIGTIVFKPKVKGSFTFSGLSSFGKETTKFVNDKTEVIYPALNEVKVTVN
jgi:hypothetical protein